MTIRNKIFQKIANNREINAFYAKHYNISRLMEETIFNTVDILETEFIRHKLNCLANAPVRDKVSKT